MKVIRGLSTDMGELTTGHGRKDTEVSFGYALWCAANAVHEAAPAYAPKMTADNSLSLPPAN